MLRQHLTKTKPYDSIQASNNVVYHITWECGRDYVGETNRPLDVGKKNIKITHEKVETAKSKLSKHAWEKEQV